MRSEDTPREPVSVASDGERPLPDARGPVTGAPKGNQNALKHGRYTAKALDDRREIAALLRAIRELAKEVSESTLRPLFCPQSRFGHRLVGG